MQTFIHLSYRLFHISSRTRSKSDVRRMILILFVLANLEGNMFTRSVRIFLNELTDMNGCWRKSLTRSLVECKAAPCSCTKYQPASKGPCRRRTDKTLAVALDFCVYSAFVLEELSNWCLTVFAVIVNIFGPKRWIL